MYAGTRQADEKSGMVEEFTQGLKEGAIPLIRMCLVSKPIM